MTRWPNWIDLLIVSIIFKTCYNGFVRGILAELLNLIGAVGVTAVTLNFAGVVTKWLQPWITTAPYIVTLIGFWGLFFALFVMVRLIVRRVTELLRWERLYWFVQGIGLFFGGVRGLWWAGFLLVVLVSSGFPFLAVSVEKGSVLGPRLLVVAQVTLEQVADRFPGAPYRPVVLVPPIQPTSKTR